MLVDFSFENLRSFRDRHHLTMQAAALRSNDLGLDEGNVYQSINDIRLLKSKVIFGPNASGKSNLIRAFRYFISMVKNSVSEETLPDRIWNDRFALVDDWDDQPVYFQMVFICQGVEYRYGFALMNGVIHSEWLFGRPNVQEVKFFVRTQEEGISISETNFKEAKVYQDLTRDGQHEIFRPQTLFLTGAALMGNSQAQALRNEITSLIIVDGLSDKVAAKFSMEILESEAGTMAVAIRNLIAAADPSIKDLQVETSTDESDESKIRKKLFSYRDLYDLEGAFVKQIPTYFGNWESEGTKKLFDISGLVLFALKYGKPLIIDEFDARFHPVLSKSIIELFHHPNTNPRNAQLIIVTHDASLLSRIEFRRDQICLVDKNQFGISSITSLIEYKGVRKDASYEKEYLQGKYGAIPFLGNIDHIIESMLADDKSGKN